ncbi:MAG: hypothetical protein ACI8TX_000356 [Hyphomicrobiaceae bacterium]|jgi:hypothetical protein
MHLRSPFACGTLPRAVILTLLFCLAPLGSDRATAAEPAIVIDLADTAAEPGVLTRVHGSVGNGAFGVPVAAGGDCDNDGFQDYAFASMTASSSGGTSGGIAYLVFGSGALGETLDTQVAQERILEIHGAGAHENAGSELWMDDVTGDGIGDLLIARQNYTAGAGRIGTGALTILVGGPELRTHAATLTPIDLASPPAALTVFTLVGANEFDRLGIWMRTGDVSGDGIADIAIGADQRDLSGGANNGAVFVVRGGSHLAVDAEIDLLNFGATSLAGDVALILPPTGTNEYHVGATVTVGDLDGNGRAEVIAAAALNRAGAALLANGAPFGSARPVGGSAKGTAYIIWDDNFPLGTGAWSAGLTLTIGSLPGSLSEISGGTGNRSFGEELIAGFDFDDDGNADLFVGDIVGDISPASNRTNAGSGHVFFDASALKGLTFDRDNVPGSVSLTDFIGDFAGGIAADTALAGDFDNDGIDDLAFSAPHAPVLNRTSAGTLYVFYGQAAGFPATVDLRTLPAPAVLRVTRIDGAIATSGGDTGDTLAYSAAPADIDQDGTIDLVVNEMEGNGTDPSAIDVGNVVIIGGAFSAVGLPVTLPCGPLPETGCTGADDDVSRLRLRNREGEGRDKLVWKWTRGGETELADFGSPGVGTDAYRFCVYAGLAGGGPDLQAFLPAGAICKGGRECWTPKRARGWRYKDGDASRGGVAKFILLTGDAGKARIRLSARKSELSLDDFPATTPITVQLIRGTETIEQCWQNTFE